MAGKYIICINILMVGHLWELYMAFTHIITPWLQQLPVLVQPIADTTVNVFNGKGVNWLHFAIQVWPTFLISDILALWHSGLSARVPEFQKLRM